MFQSLRGVGDVAQGFIRSEPPNDGWSEAVIVTFDQDEIGLDVLTDIHLHTHASTSAHKMRGKYRSAVYTFDAAQSDAVHDVLSRLQSGFGKPLVTRVLPFAGFKPSDERFQDYYGSGPQRPFCRTYIDPKLALLRARFANQVGGQVPQKV